MENNQYQISYKIQSKICEKDNITQHKQDIKLSLFENYATTFIYSDPQSLNQLLQFQNIFNSIKLNNNFEFTFKFFQYNEEQVLQSKISTGKFQQKFYLIQEVQQSEEDKNNISLEKLYICMGKYDNKLYSIKRNQEPFFIEQQKLIIEDPSFFKEIKILTQLIHPNLVRYYNWWFEKTNQDNNEFFLYLQMEHVGEISLQSMNLRDYIIQYLSKVSDIQYVRKQAYCLFNQALSCLKYIHGLNIVHRGIKPENCFIDNIDLEQQIHLKLGAFGHSKNLLKPDDNGMFLKTKSISIELGNYYLPPEATSLQQKIYVPESDIYCLGCVFFDILHRNVVDEKLPMKQSDFWHKNISQEQIFPDNFQELFPEETEIIQKMLNIDYANRNFQNELQSYQNIFSNYNLQ